MISKNLEIPKTRTSLDHNMLSLLLLNAIKRVSPILNVIVVTSIIWQWPYRLRINRYGVEHRHSCDDLDVVVSFFCNEFIQDVWSVLIEFCYIPRSLAFSCSIYDFSFCWEECDIHVKHGDLVGLLIDLYNDFIIIWRVMGGVEYKFIFFVRFS